MFTEKECNIVARSKDIKEPQNISTEELLNALSTYDSKQKVKTNHKNY